MGSEMCIRDRTTPLICEGGIASACAAVDAIQRGADAVVVGTAITGVDLQVAAYRQRMDVQTG